MNTNPIVILDSGIGGLITLKILEREFPQENFLYFKDTTNFPYGEKEPEILAQIVENNLVNIYKKTNFKFIVLACHTASVVKIKNKSNILEKKIINIAESSLWGLSKIIIKQNFSKIGIISSQATFDSQVYRDFWSEYISSSNCKLFEQPLSQIIRMIENGESPNKIKSNLKKIITPEIRNCEVILLGCTHFYWIVNTLREVFGPQCMFVEGAFFVRDYLKSCIKNSPSICEANLKSEYVEV